ncbi:MAG: hypothetical protein ACLU62_01590 [Hydrogeniiclostridium sp.]
MFGWVEIYSSLNYEKAEERRLLLEGKGFRCKMKIKTGARFSPGGETRPAAMSRDRFTTPSTVYKLFVKKKFAADTVGLLHL